MITAGDRLKQISGLAGISAAAMLLSVGTGVTAGELLASRSGLLTGSTAEHLLAEGQLQPAPNGNIRIGFAPTIHAVTVAAAASTFESEVSVAQPTSVILCGAIANESTVDIANGTTSVDKKRIAQLDEDLIWL